MPQPKIECQTLECREVIFFICLSHSLSFSLLKSSLSLHQFVLVRVNVCSVCRFGSIRFGTSVFASKAKHMFVELAQQCNRYFRAFVDPDSSLWPSARKTIEKKNALICRCYFTFVPVAYGNRVMECITMHSVEPSPCLSKVMCRRGKNNKRQDGCALLMPFIIYLDEEYSVG